MVELKLLALKTMFRDVMKLSVLKVLKDENYAGISAYQRHCGHLFDDKQNRPIHNQYLRFSRCKKEILDDKKVKFRIFVTLGDQMCKTINQQMGHLVSTSNHCLCSKEKFHHNSNAITTMYNKPSNQVQELK